MTARSDDPAPAGPHAAAWVAGGAALALAAFGLTLRRYGFELVDEGTLLAQYGRVHAGQWPYRDFHTGYGPGAFVLHRMLFGAFGAHVDVVRAALVATHAVGFAALGWLAARAVGTAGAIVALALAVAFFLPVAPGAFCLANIPYPGWYAQALGALALVAALSSSRRGAAMLVVAGALWGAATCFKQNAGLLGLAATLVWRAFERSAAASPPGLSAIGVALGMAVAAGALGVVAGGSLGAFGAVAIAGPALALAMSVARLRPSLAFAGDVAALGAGFALVVAPALAAIVAVAGWGSVATEVLHLGSDAAAVYAEPYPGIRALTAAASRAASGLRAAREATDLAWFVVFPAVHAIAALRLRPGRGAAAWRLVVPAAVLSYVQLFPRADFWHLVPTAGLSLVPAIGVALAAAGRAGSAAAMALLLALAAVRAIPTAGVVADALSASPAGLPTLERATLRWDLMHAPERRAVPDVVAALAEAPAVIGFPALGAFNFLTGTTSPLRHDYFFPGVPRAWEVPDVLARIAGAADAYAVVLHDDVAFFPAAFAAHREVERAIATSFADVRRIGPYEVRRRRP